MVEPLTDAWIEAMDMALGEACHLVNQKGWRNHPGHNAHGSFHADEIFVELPEELAADPRYEPAIHIVTALNYLVDIDAQVINAGFITKKQTSHS